MASFDELITSLWQDSANAIYIINPESHNLVGGNTAAYSLHQCSESDIEKVDLEKVFIQYNKDELSEIFQSLIHASESTKSRDKKQLRLTESRASRSQRVYDVTLQVTSHQNESYIVAEFQEYTARHKFEEALKSLAKMVTTLNDDSFYRKCVIDLAQIYDAKYCFIGLIDRKENTASSFVACADGNIVDNFSYELHGTPCDDVIHQTKSLIPTNVCELYPSDLLLQQMGCDSYYGTPLRNESNEIMGILVVLDSKPMELADWVVPVLDLFAARIEAELNNKLQNEKLRSSNSELEDLVNARTRELESTNKELETFSYSVSHDLRAPLRSIAGFAQVLNEQCASKLDEEENDFLTRISTSAEKMGRLIDDLLKMAKVTQLDIVKKEISLSHVVDYEFAVLQATQPDRKVELILQDDLKVFSDETLIDVIISNLVSNAWKYSAKSESAKIEFGKEQIRGESVFFVKDNGAGFDMEQAANLFDAFKRLHSKDEFEGSGIGLAAVQRAINKLGGKIWANAEEGKGACFYFSLPAEDIIN